MIRFHGMTLCPSVTAELLCATDWTPSPLGPPVHWPPALRQAVQLCLNSRFPMLLIWGPERITLYNDGFLPILGEQHPDGFARRVAEVFPAMVDSFTPALDAALAGRESRLYADHLLPVTHAGRVEEAYFTFCLSPVNDADGTPGGVLSVASETSPEVLQRRRSASIECLAEELARQSVLEPISPALRRVIATNPSDFGVTALYRVKAEGPERLWCEPESAAPDLEADGELPGHLAGLGLTGKRTAMTRLNDRVFVLSMVDEDVIPGEALVLVVKAGDLVRTDAGYEAFLRVVQESAVGAVCRVFGERRAMAAETRRADERDRMYRLLFERSHDGVLICGPDGSIGAANPAACAMLGYTENEIQALGREGLVDDGDGSLTASLEERRGDGSFVGELKFRRKDGTLLPVDVSSTVFRDDEAGGADRAVTLFRDATPRLATQERVATTARLEAVGALTGGIAHDFNNLLNVIINGAEDLMDRLPEPDPGRTTADMVLSASMRAADLTRQLLAFSRQQPMTPQTVDTSRTVADMDQILSRTMGGGIEVTMDTEAGAYAVADNSLLQSAILNLCINARDSMPEGGHLSIDAGLVPVDEALAESLSVEPGNYVRIGVADTGVGIPAEHLDRILEPFYTTKPAGRGTGLGLSMVFGFVRQSGGGLRILSTVGEGTRVELYLPRAADRAVPEHEAPLPAPEQRTGGTGRLLVVEDESLLASMLERILQDAGYRVTVCATGEQALELLDGGEPFDAMLTDILLGSGMDGWSLQREVAARGIALPVITMSGYTPPEPGRHTDEPQVPTLHKPFRPREVLAVLDSLLAA